MKREDLKQLELSDEVIDKVMALHGADIESHKARITTMQTELDTTQAQLTEAGATIEGFKRLDIDAIKAAADDYKAKFEQAQTESAAQLASLKFDHALESALTTAKAKNPRAVQALLSRDLLKLNDADGSIIGLNEQLETIKKDNDYLFADAKETPKIVVGGSSQKILGNAFTEAARRGAKLPEG
jgi:Phage minor structural protein GP20